MVKKLKEYEKITHEHLSEDQIQNCDKESLANFIRTTLKKLKDVQTLEVWWYLIGI